MKLKIISLIILLLLTNVSIAQLLSEKTDPKVNTKYKNHFNFSIGGDLIVAGLLGGGNDLKAGIGYRTQKINYSAIVEYINISWKAIMSEREYKVTILHPHLKLGYQLNRKLEIFAFLGIGMGDFEVEIYNGNILEKNKTLTSFGFGIKYWYFMLTYRAFQPDVTLSFQDGMVLMNYPIDTHKNQFAIGAVFDINLNKFFTDND